VRSAHEEEEGKGLISSVTLLILAASPSSLIDLPFIA